MSKGRPTRPRTPDLIAPFRVEDPDTNRALGDVGQATRELQRDPRLPRTGAIGDVFYRAADGRVVALPPDVNGEVLTLVAGLPAWAAAGGVGPPGPAGPAGAAGATGPAGAAGASGAMGPPGLDGDEGPAGVPGAPGPAGIDGAAGAAGAAGAQGLAGPPGLDGQDGVDGDRGPLGPQGDRGATGVAGPMGSFRMGSATALVTGSRRGARSGRFEIEPTAPFTSAQIGAPVIVQQTGGRVPGRGRLGDDAEWDGIACAGEIVSARKLRVSWTSRGLVRGAFNFAYMTP